MVNDASLKRELVTINGYQTGYPFTLGIPITAIIIDRGIAGFDIQFIFYSETYNLYYIIFGIAPDNNFNNFEIITDYKCIVYYIPN